jgi:hypothetical protein
VRPSPSPSNMALLWLNQPGYPSYTSSLSFQVASTISVPHCRQISMHFQGYLAFLILAQVYVKQD